MMTAHPGLQDDEAIITSQFQELPWAHCSTSTGTHDSIFERSYHKG